MIFAYVLVRAQSVVNIYNKEIQTKYSEIFRRLKITSKNTNEAWKGRIELLRRYCGPQ